MYETLPANFLSQIQLKKEFNISFMPKHKANKVMFI